MKPKHQRLLYVLVSLAVFGLAVGLALRALREEIVYFHSPSEIAALTSEAKAKPMRLGGLVVKGSLVQRGDTRRFTLTDGVADREIVFAGILPALFREGQGIVAEGRLEGDRFVATTVLAKHDEKYMPPEVARKLKDSGYWKKNAAAAPFATQPMEGTR